MRLSRSVMLQSDVRMEMLSQFHVIPLLPKVRLRFTLAAAILLCCCLVAKPTQTQRDAAAKESYEAGIAALKQQDLATARKKFEEAAQMVPQSAEAHNSLGYVLLLTGDVDGAVRELGNATRLMPTLPQ